MTPALAVSLGDPAGVGPEIIISAWVHRNSASLSPFFVAGGLDVLGQASRQNAQVPIIPIASPGETYAAFERGIPVLPQPDGPYTPGKPDPAGARCALSSLELATKLVRERQASALVTAPVAKSRLTEVGFDYPGQTEFLANACGINSDDAVMMLAGPHLRTVPLTVHLALGDVPGRISEDLIISKARIVAAALRRDFGIDRPRLAIAALNPHAGEDGLFGMEDDLIVAPAIARLQAEGHLASGPHPADGLFSPRAREDYDVALCMYHDQALIPIKALDFDSGVNITLGLPIIRTSPDHGTAFAIAGKELANSGAMIAAIKLAGECATRRFAR